MFDPSQAIPRWSEWVADPAESDLPSLTKALAALDGPADEVGGWPAELWSTLKKAGAVGWSLPEAFGGDPCNRALLLTRYARVAEGSLTAAFVLSQHDAAVRRLASASDRMAARSWLERVGRGTAFPTVGLSQLTTSRRHGPHALQASERPGGGYTLEGAMPWVTAAERADVVVAGAAMADGRQMLIALPADRAGVEVRSPFPLAALQASRTAEIGCSNVTVADSEVLAGPAADVTANPGAAGTGGLETSALALGQARAALVALAAETAARPDLAEPRVRDARILARRLAGPARHGRRAARGPGPRTGPRGRQRPGPPRHASLPHRPQRERIPPLRARAKVGAAGPLLPRLVVPEPRGRGDHPGPRGRLRFMIGPGLDPPCETRGEANRPPRAGVMPTGAGGCVLRGRTGSTVGVLVFSRGQLVVGGAEAVGEG